MKHLQITIPEGYEIDKDQSTFENIVFKPFVKTLPKTWEDLGKIDGYYVHSATTSIIARAKTKTVTNNRNVFATKEQAEACIALAQLSQLIKVYNDGWVPDWNSNDYKYAIVYYDYKLIIECRCSYATFLAFKTQELAKTFLENFKDLITIAKPLLS